MIIATFKSCYGRKYEIPVKTIEQADKIIANAFKHFGEITNVNVKVKPDEQTKFTNS